MRVLLINGSPRKDGNTAAALSVAEQELHANAIRTKWFQIGTQPIRGCIGCGACRKTNRCAFGDDRCNELIEEILAADGIIIGSPVYFAAPNGALCALLDRVFYATCTYSQLFKGKPAAALATCAWAGGTAALDRLHRYFVPCHMPVATADDYTVFQGNSVNDGEARSIELLRTLGKNLSALVEKTGRQKADGEV